MDALRDLEEAGVAPDHGPPCIDARTARVREQRLQQLGDTAPGCRRVDVQHLATVEQRTRLASHRGKRFGAFSPDERFKSLRRDAPHMHLLQPHRCHARGIPRARLEYGVMLSLRT